MAHLPGWRARQAGRRGRCAKHRPRHRRGTRRRSARAGGRCARCADADGRRARRRPAPAELQEHGEFFPGDPHPVQRLPGVAQCLLGSGRVRTAARHCLGGARRPAGERSGARRRAARARRAGDQVVFRFAGLRRAARHDPPQRQSARGGARPAAQALRRRRDLGIRPAPARGRDGLGARAAAAARALARPGGSGARGAARPQPQADLRGKREPHRDLRPVAACRGAAGGHALGAAAAPAGPGRGRAAPRRG